MMIIPAILLKICDWVINPSCIFTPGGNDHIYILIDVLMPGNIKMMCMISIRKIDGF